MEQSYKFATLAGRVLLALIFFIAGIQKLADPASTAAYMEGFGIPGWLAIPVGIFEVVLALAFAIGLLTRISGMLLALFTLVAALVFHTQFGDPTQTVMFLKNLAIVGGFLLVLRAPLDLAVDNLIFHRSDRVGAPA